MQNRDPKLIEDMREYVSKHIKEKKEKKNGTTGHDTAEVASEEDEDLFSDEVQTAFVDDLRWDIPDPSRYLGRVPALDLNQYGRMNILSWCGLRTTFRSFGDRFKLRMDGVSVFLFVTFLSIIGIIAVTSICVSTLPIEEQEDNEVEIMILPSSAFCY